MKKRVLVVHPFVRPHGGGHAVAAWTLEALKSTCDLSLLTWARVEYEGVNDYFGTSLKPGEFRIYRTPKRTSRALLALPTPSMLLQLGLMQRWCQQLDARHHFDVLIGTHNEMDFGRRGIQYVHFPWSSWPRPDVEWRWYHGRRSVDAYRAFCSWIGNVSVPRLRTNLTLANSSFIAGKIREAHGIDAMVLPPPVPGGFPCIAWQAREDSFVGIGRLSREKRWERAVEIIERVRETGREVRLTLICTPDNPDYERQIRALASKRPWVTLHTNLPRQEMVRIVARHRYGIHPMEGEHFGIAVAEEQRGGCLPFVHNSGGPVEIVGNDRHLIFDTAEDAANKILRVLDSAAFQQELCGRATERAELFTSEIFMQRIRQIVDEFRSS